jgi:hypothetical protein
MVVLDASAHKCMGKSWSWIIALVASTIDLFFLSATPFYWGLLGVVKSLLIPASLQKSLSSFEVYSPPLSDLKILIFLQERFSTKALNS